MHYYYAQKVLCAKFLRRNALLKRAFTRIETKENLSLFYEVNIKEKLTKLPPSLHKGQLWVVHEKGHCPPQEFGIRLEIGIKDCNIITLSNIAMFHPFLEGTGLVPIPVISHLILDIHTLFDTPFGPTPMEHILVINISK